jgi:hypothetical protein
MGISVFPIPSAGSKTAFNTTLTSGSSWTVPAGVNYINVTTVGGGGGGGTSRDNAIKMIGGYGLGGQVMHSTLNTTPGANINYSIGAGGNAGTVSFNNSNGGYNANNAGSGGTTTFTGATSAAGGGGSGSFDNSAFSGASGQQGITASNGGSPSSTLRTDFNSAGPNGGSGGAGYIVVQYWA